MGNNCVCFGSRISKNREVPDFSNSDGCCTRFINLILPNNRKANAIATPCNNEPYSNDIVAGKPPEVPKIEKDDPKPVPDEKATKKDQVPDSKKSSQPKRRVEESRVVAEASTSRTTTQKATSAEPKKPYNVKRQAVAGLKAESVLQTKTGNLKEFYTLGRKLGNGQFGTTFLCVEKDTGKEYACKSIAKRKLKNEDDVEDVRREIRIMHHLAGCPNVISIKGSYEDAVAVHVVMELCSGGELFDRIVQRGHYSERKAAQIARTIVGVIEACHSLGVMHRDLKPENFLFINEHEDSPLKAIDFGLSTFFKPRDIFRDVVGSPYYVAPEVLKKRYGPEADVWSAGVIIYILLSGVPPFWAESEADIFNEVLHREIDFKSDPWPNISESAKDLVRKMIDRDPSKRLTAHEILCHPWIRVDGSAPDKPLDPAVLTRLKQFSAMDKLKKMALRVIAKNLSEEEIAGLKEMFKMIDTDNSGQISFEELKAGLKAYGANIDESEIHSLMRAADVDNSGTLDYTEFITATMNLNKAWREDNLVAAFHYFDKDGSGYITQDELQRVCEEFGLENVRLEDIIREADQNNDGRIDYSEFVAMMQGSNADMGKKGVKGKK
ncbi:hypothetical protein QN277_021177 [Acacia crassicarpa]|uniref:non-specific serine/threonine protein kinase n=1 Tax=Acacia crassicarpa TaxID=499986 RepID=A0AAE1JPN9_9FABA|nr:hypothetical protein QN277_021177 [Acacia crassicarpa]